MNDGIIESSRILIVDDQDVNIRILQRMLAVGGYLNVRGVSDPREALTNFLEFEPDIVLVDLHMPYLDGHDVMKEIETHVSESDFLPFVMLTADVTKESRLKALSNGAKDFLTKPLDGSEVLLRVGNLLRTRSLHIELAQRNEILSEAVRDRTEELEKAQVEILDRLAMAAEYRDDETGLHTRRVADNSAGIARGLGLPDDMVELVKRAAPLHDVGKIAIPDEILLKNGRLTPEEFEIMKTHVKVGSRILTGSEAPLLRLAEEIARTHHECWDGSGYADGLEGKAIPLAGRIVAVADVFDALTSNRPYKEAWSVEDALDEIDRQAGHQFDPQVVRAFLAMHGRTPSATEDRALAR